MSAPPPAPEFIVTNVGLAAADVATPVGPFVHITGFRVGDGYGYTALPTDTSINGNLLYEGVPSTYQYVGDNTLDIICKIPAEAGPFKFGEVAIDLVGTVMFAKAAFAEPQTKYSSLGTNVQSTYTFHCLLKLAQSVAIFKIDTIAGDPPAIWEVDFWSDVYPPALMANPLIPAILVRELDSKGNSSLIHQASDAHWSMASNYHQVATVNATQGTLTSVTLAQQPNIQASAIPRNYVIETADGYMRSCSSVTSSGGNLIFNFIDPLTALAPPVGSPISVFSNNTLETELIITGDISGQAIISGQSVTISVTLDQQSSRARSQTYATAGTYPFVVPPGVTFLYVSGAGAGGGGGGAGSGASTDHVPGSDYTAGGGGGGGGNGQSVNSRAVPVNPGETVTVVVGAAGIGGVGGPASGNNGNNGTNGAANTISGSFGTITLAGGTAGTGGGGYGDPSGRTGDGGQPGIPGGFFGTDGAVGCQGGNGGTSPFGSGGPGARGATGNATTGSGAPGGNGSGNGSGGGGGGAVYVATSSSKGGDGGNGTDGIWEFTW